MAPAALAKNNCELDPGEFLATAGEGRKVVTFLRKQPIFAQGDSTDAVFYILEGRISHTVVSRFGKEATLGILSKGEFFGDGGLAGQPLRMDSATAMTDCKLLQIDKEAMMLALHRGRALSNLFVAHLLARNIRYNEGLVDLLFDSSERRLARVLLLLAHFGEMGSPDTVIPKVSQATLAAMAGTARMRIRVNMNRFRKSGFLAHTGSGFEIHSSLLNVVLND
ncbi:MAG: Crp/Fnr family transcriptional regulator [Terracidiphilus sp.]|jgi:CRP-like cAMP-binding protein